MGQQKEPDSLDTSTQNEDRPQSDELVISEDLAMESSSQNANDVGHQLSKLAMESGQEKHNNTLTTDLFESSETICNLKPIESDSLTQNDNFGSTFKGFDIVQEPSDHHFIETSGQVIN